MIGHKNASREQISEATAEGGGVDKVVAEDEDGIASHHISWRNRVCMCGRVGERGQGGERC